MSYLSRMGILGQLALASRQPAPFKPAAVAPQLPTVRPRLAAAPKSPTLKDGTTLRDILRGQGIRGRGTPQQIALAADIFDRLKQLEGNES